MTTPKISTITGVILAGGASRRFGTNKALADLDGVPLIRRVADTMQGIFSHTLLVTNSPAPYKFLNWPICSDIFANSGPLAGIHSALQATSAKGIFVCACDMPFLNALLIRYLCARLADFDVVLPVSERGPEPLYAVYGQSALGVIEKNLAAGELKISKTIRELRARKIGTAEVLSVVEDLTCFHNINRPGDMPPANTP